MKSDHMSAQHQKFGSYMGPSSYDNFSPRTGVEGGNNHFEIPNLSSMLYDYTNKEKDLIEKCWRVGNYHSLRDLPSHLAPSNVLKSYQEKQDLAHLPSRPK